MKNFIDTKSLILFSLYITAIFPSMAVLISGRCLPVGYIFLIISFLILFSFLYKKLFKDILSSLLIKSSKFLVLFFSCSIATSFFAGLFFGISFLKMLLSLFLAFVLSMFLPYFISFFASRRIDEKKIISFYTIVLYIIMVLGLVDFIIFYFKIPFLDILYNSTIINSRLYKMGEIFSLLNLAKNSDIPRVQAVFEEPSHFGWFICVNLPLILSVSLSKYDIFRGKLKNFIVKKTFIIFTALCLLLTQSPINIVFALIITGVFLMIKYRLSLRSIFKIVLVSMFVLVIGLCLVYISSPEQTILYRIKMVLTSFSSFDRLITVEGSLGTRLVYYTLMFKIFMQNVITGCGWGNLGIFLYNEIASTSLPLTLEIYARFLYNIDGNIGYTPSIFFRTIAETGIFGIIILYLFLFKTKSYAKYLYLHSSNLAKDFYFGINLVMLNYILLSFYDSNLYIGYFWILFGMISARYLTSKMNKD